MAAHYKVKYGLEDLEKSLTIAYKRFSRTVDYNEDARSSSTDKSLTSNLPKLLADSLDESKSDDDDGDNDIPYMVIHPPKRVSSTHCPWIEWIFRQNCLTSL